MTKTEVAMLLTMAAAFDRRTIGDADVLAWHQILERVVFEDAKQAIVDHYGSTRDWLMPVDVLTAVKRMRKDRLSSVELVPDADPDDVPAYIDALRSQRLRVADGGAWRDTRVLQLGRGVS